MAKCNFMERARSFAEREVGCPLTHCVRGHHVDIPDGYPWADTHCAECAGEEFCGACGAEAHEGLTCDEAAQDPERAKKEQLAADIEAAERAAGWDPSP